jgi:hypothetical protein
MFYKLLKNCPPLSSLDAFDLLCTCGKPKRRKATSEERNISTEKSLIQSNVWYYVKQVSENDSKATAFHPNWKQLTDSDSD